MDHKPQNFDIRQNFGFFANVKLCGLLINTTRVRSKVERSRACAPLTKTQVWDSGFFAHALFVPKTPNAMGFSGSVNGTTKNPGFLDFGFCQCKWASCWVKHPLGKSSVCGHDKVKLTMYLCLLVRIWEVKLFTRYSSMDGKSSPQMYWIFVWSHVETC